MNEGQGFDGRGEGSCGFATALNLKGAVLSPQKGP